MDLSLDLAWEAATRNGHAFALLMLDIDHFKKFNDHYGHLAGDDCLRTVASAVSGAVRACAPDGAVTTAFAARYGGEEFAVIIPSATRQLYTEIADAVLESVRGAGIAHERNDAWRIVTTSVGGAYMPSTCEGIAQMFRTADMRLYQAKEAGRNRAVLH